MKGDSDDRAYLALDATVAFAKSRRSHRVASKGQNLPLAPPRLGILIFAEYLVPAGSKHHIEDSATTQTPPPAGNVADNENSVLRCQKLPCVAAQAAHIADRLINTRAVQRPNPGPAKLHTMPTRIVASSKLLPISAKILQPVLMFRLPQRSEYPW